MHCSIWQRFLSAGLGADTLASQLSKVGILSLILNGMPSRGVGTALLNSMWAVTNSNLRQIQESLPASLPAYLLDSTMDNVFLQLPTQQNPQTPKP